MDIIEILASIWPLLLMVVVMWFLLIRPAQKRQKETRTMQESLKRGDEIITIGGIHGKIDAVDDTAVYLRVAEGTLMQFERQAVARVKTDGQ